MLWFLALTGASPHASALVFDCNAIEVANNIGMTAVGLQGKVSKWYNRDLSVFSRAMVCNIFLVEKLFYVLQVLHCPKIQIEKCHRIFALIIWNSGSEPM